MHTRPDAAKPVNNLALRVIQRYYAELCEALSIDPHQVAVEMYSRKLISREEKRKAVEGQGYMITPLQRAEVLMQALERATLMDGKWTALTAFCQLLEKRPSSGRIAARMKAMLS